MIQLTRSFHLPRYLCARCRSRAGIAESLGGGSTAPTRRRHCACGTFPASHADRSTTMFPALVGRLFVTSFSCSSFVGADGGGSAEGGGAINSCIYRRQGSATCCSANWCAVRNMPVNKNKIFYKYSY